jgi:predicted ATPase
VSTRFTRLVLANWRNFRNVDLPLRQRMFLVGPNASGKTNLLDAFRFLRDIAASGGSLVRAVQERRGMKHLRSLHAG